MEFVELVFLIKHDVIGLSLNTTDRILSSLIQGLYEMVLKLLFEYGEHEWLLDFNVSVQNYKTVVTLNNRRIGSILSEYPGTYQLA